VRGPSCLLASALCGVGAAAFAASASAPAAAPSAQVPLCVGLTIVTAVEQPNGDYESIKTVESIAGDVVRLKYSSERMVSDLLAPGPPTLTTMTHYRSVRRQDLQNAASYAQEFSDDLPETIPGTTAIGVSRQVLDRLKRAGQAELAISAIVPGQPLGIDAEVRPNVYDYLQAAPLVRAADRPVMLPVVVNDRAVMLPGIRATRDTAGERSEFVFLDDLDNPIALQFRIGIDALKPWGPDMRELMKGVTAANPAIPAMFGLGNDPEGGDRARLRVVKLAFRCAPAGGDGATGTGAGRLERSLAETGRAEVYDIFFTFNSDVIRPESEPTLGEIARLLRTRPDWSLSIEGHTDGVASDTFNLELSKRRAASVKAALTTRHGVSAARLSTAGFGESRPRDTNDTLEGRARNRRVELVRVP